jgi:hypothetical protein
LNRRGAACAATPGPDGLCRWHTPSNAAERTAWCRRGGAARSNAARARKELAGAALTPAELVATLCRAMAKVEAGQLEPGPATAMAGLARAILACTSAADVESRLVALERRA